MRKVTSTGMININDGFTIFDFDVNNYRIEKQAAKELQASFEVSAEDIKRMNDYFLREFPFMRIPISNIKKLVDEKKVE